MFASCTSATFFNNMKPPAAKGLKHARTPISTKSFKVCIQGTVAVELADLNWSISALNNTWNVNTVCLMLQPVAAEHGGHLNIGYWFENTMHMV